MATPSLYLKHEMAIKDLPANPTHQLGNKWMFVGIDMAPIENLETGMAVLDRSRQIQRMDKLNTDDDLLLFLDNLSTPENLLVALDIPKSLSIQSKWRQQQIKMHPLCLEESEETVPSDRYAQRAKEFYTALTQRGIFVVSFFTSHAKLRYDLNIPYRNRSPQGCRALQALLKSRLNIPNVPTNLAPSSVLDALIASYVAWSVYAGKEGLHYQLYQDDEQRLYIDPMKRVRPTQKTRRR